MNMTTERVDGIDVLALDGRFDAHGAPAVQAWIRERLDGGATAVIIDLQDVNFVDSAALAVLVNGMKACRGRGGDLVVCSVQQPVGIIFELTRLDRAIRLLDDRADASRALAAPEAVRPAVA